MADTSSIMSDNTNQDILSNHFIPNICHTPRATELLYASINGTVHDKLIARKTYFLLTFSIMLEFKGQNSSRRYTSIPFIFALNEELGSINKRIATHFGLAWCELTVAFEGNAINSATARQDRKLDAENIFTMLRLLRQRGGVDVLLVDGDRMVAEGDRMVEGDRLTE